MVDRQVLLHERDIMFFLSHYLNQINLRITEPFWRGEKMLQLSGRIGPVPFTSKKRGDYSGTQQATLTALFERSW
jgi:hypothetical protein